ncbi:3-oxoadipate enol-lactonase [Solwaraspora sp. WMMD406]|uniref:3-oxoadipate enol-lactonase n=1 Tax=Solwaraspora sp. WMMD406 TaxID=3016095 RepID=UPI0024174CA0|nr:3-oxoadipate enol-lactonase [Solwaraspora sp. WMMD406]MDG4767151.1 3-oxoadipate enol-lactonase [Solwaraspora sp. WMMD406]
MTRSPAPSTPPSSSTPPGQPTPPEQPTPPGQPALPGQPSPPGAGPVELAYELVGPDDGPVVLLANSLGSTRRMWDPQVPALTDAGFRVLRCDTRGHGASPVPPGPYTIADLGADALALLDQLGLDRVHVAGVSLGGMIGMWLGAYAPQRVDRLVLSCTSAWFGPAQTWWQRAATVRARGTEAVADVAVARWFTPGFAVRAPAAVAAARAMIAATPAEGYAGCCAVLARADLTAVLPSIVAPTLVIAGADDPATPPEHASAIVDALPDATMVVVPDAAHLANLEQPERVSRLILDHLTGRVDPELTDPAKGIQR